MGSSHPALVKHMTPHEIECGMCGTIDNHDHPDDRKAIPFFNGEPTTEDGECDGYKAVCAKCYQRWLSWNERLSASQVKIEATIVASASDALSLLRSYAADPDTPENRSAMAGQFHAVMALVQLGHLAGSGLSDSTIAELQRIDSEASGVFGAAYIEKSAGSLSAGAASSSALASAISIRDQAVERP